MEYAESNNGKKKYVAIIILIVIFFAGLVFYFWKYKYSVKEQFVEEHPENNLEPAAKIKQELEDMEKEKGSDSQLTVEDVNVQLEEMSKNQPSGLTVEDIQRQLEDMEGN